MAAPRVSTGGTGFFFFCAKNPPETFPHQSHEHQIIVSPTQTPGLKKSSPSRQEGGEGTHFSGSCRHPSAHPSASLFRTLPLFFFFRRRRRYPNAGIIFLSSLSLAPRAGALEKKQRFSGRGTTNIQHPDLSTGFQILWDLGMSLLELLCPFVVGFRANQQEDHHFGGIT